MTKQEFERRMERARKHLVKNERAGICLFLMLNFDYSRRVDMTFSNYFAPMCHVAYWLRDQENRDDNMTQLERRLVFLESFKGFCEAYKLYKEWS